MSTRIQDRLAGYIESSIEQHSGNDQVQWDLGVFPAPNGQIVHTFTLVCPSPVLGEYFQANGVIPNAYEITEKDCDTMVLQSLEQMRNQQSKVLSSPVPEPEKYDNVIPIGAHRDRTTTR